MTKIRIYDDDVGYKMMSLDWLGAVLRSQVQVSDGAMGLQVSSLLEALPPDNVIDMDELDPTRDYAMNVATPLLFLNKIIHGHDVHNKPVENVMKTVHDVECDGAYWAYANLLFRTLLVEITASEVQLLIFKNGVQYGIPVGLGQISGDTVAIQGGRVVPAKCGDRIHMALKPIGAALQNFSTATGFMNIIRCGISQKKEIQPPSVNW